MFIKIQALLQTGYDTRAIKVIIHQHVQQKQGIIVNFSFVFWRRCVVSSATGYNNKE